MCVCVCVWERERERERGSHHITVESAVLIAVCVQIHTSFITVSVTWLCSPLRLELMLKLRTLLTVFIFTLKAEARNNGKGCYISDECLWCSANHNALCQLANQSRLRLVGRRDFVENCVWESRGNNVQYLKNNVFFEHKHANIFCYTKYTKYWSYKNHHMTPLTVHLHFPVW